MPSIQPVPRTAVPKPAQQRFFAPCNSCSDTDEGHLMRQLQEPLQIYMLPELPAANFVALRSTSRILQHLVECAPLPSIQAASESLLPDRLHGLASMRSHLHRMLDAQRAAHRRMHQGCRAASLQLIPTAPPKQATDVLWRPDWPSSAVDLLMHRLDDASPLLRPRQFSLFFSGTLAGYDLDQIAPSGLYIH